VLDYGFEIGDFATVGIVYHCYLVRRRLGCFYLHLEGGPSILIPHISTLDGGG
jgi:hypothetical protein